MPSRWRTSISSLSSSPFSSGLGPLTPSASASHSHTSQSSSSTPAVQPDPDMPSSAAAAPSSSSLAPSASSSAMPTPPPPMRIPIPQPSPAFPPPDLQTPGGSQMEILLDHEHVVLRGVQGDTQPGILSGRLVLTLMESTNIREITLNFFGKAKVSFMESSTGSAVLKHHHHTHPLISHDWSFLEGTKKHSHTLKAGRHTFPFSLELPGELPSSLRLPTGTAQISYKLKATAVRASAFASNFQAWTNVSVCHSLPVEALEFTQTLDIENTWPGKIMYALTLPHKAFAAGDEIPVSIKFSPLTKGVRVLSLTTIVKEYSVVHTRSSSHPDTRVVTLVKHQITPDGRAQLVDTAASTSSSSHAFLRGGTKSAPASPVQRAQRGGLEPVTPFELGPSRATGGGVDLRAAAEAAAAANGMPTASTVRQADEGYFPPGATYDLAGASGAGSSASSSRAPADATPGPSTGTRPRVRRRDDDPRLAEGPEDLTEMGDGEMDDVIKITLPIWTTPSHGYYPVFLTHKIKWSCLILNRDGHTSELRCALPIHVLAPHLMDEARAATSTARNLLFGGSLADGRPPSPNTDLPSYSNHVYDRIANADAHASGTVPVQWSTGGPNNVGNSFSPMHSPASSSPAASRPTTPGIFFPGPSSVPRESHLSSRDRELHQDSGSSGAQTPWDSRCGLPARPHLNWADSELLFSLGQLAAEQERACSTGSVSPTVTPNSSRPTSRSHSRANSRPSSRASSPERRPSDGGSEGERSHHHHHGLFHVPKALRPLTTFRSNRSSGANTPHTPSVDLSSPPPGPSEGGESEEAREMRALNTVPSYDIAARGFLGGGVVPLSPGLPTYDEVEGRVPRVSSLDAGTMAQLRAAASRADGDGHQGPPSLDTLVLNDPPTSGALQARRPSLNRRTTATT